MYTYRTHTRTHYALRAVSLEKVTHIYIYYATHLVGELADVVHLVVDVYTVRLPPATVYADSPHNTYGSSLTLPPTIPYIVY
jgi:hypothetical protein